MTILQLNPPIYLDTPRGSAMAYFLISEGQDHDLYWVTFISGTRECWTFRNPEIRKDKNWTLGLGRSFPLPVTRYYEPTIDPFKLGGYATCDNKEGQENGEKS